MNAPLAITRGTLLFGAAAGAIGSWGFACRGAWARGYQPAVAAGRISSGRPLLATLLAMVLAGGGAHDFKTLTLLVTLAGSQANIALANLTKALGASAVKAFVTTFDFFVADALRLLEQDGTPLPAVPVAEAKGGPALLAALRAAGTDATTRSFRAGYLLDNLVSHRLHLRIAADIDAKYGAGAAAAFQLALGELMEQLGATTPASASEGRVQTVRRDV